MLTTFRSNFNLKAFTTQTKYLYPSKKETDGIFAKVLKNTH